MTVQVPTLETTRLRLRGHRRDDFADCVALWADPAVTKYITGRASTEQQTWSRILSYVGHWALMGFGYWAIEEKQSGSFAGEIGLADFKRDVGPSMRGTPEVGFALASRFHGAGYATEAARAVLAWADERLPCEFTVCMITPDNLASLRVVEKCGYAVFEEATHNGDPVLFLSRPRRPGARPLDPLAGSADDSAKTSA